MILWFCKIIELAINEEIYKCHLDQKSLQKPMESIIHISYRGIVILDLADEDKRDKPPPFKDIWGEK